MFGHYNDFINNFCYTYDIAPGVKAISGYKNIDKLSSLIKPYTIIIKASDVIDLPDVVERVYRVPLKGAVKKAYYQLEKDSVIDLDNDDYLMASHLLTKQIRLQQLATSGLMVGDDGNEVIFNGIEDRIATLKMLVDDINEPLVIFTRFKRDIDIIKNAIKEPVHLLTGDIDTHNSWRNGDGRILIANISAGSEGVRLERARHLIFWSVGYSNTEFQQAKARIIRAGQKAKTCFLHYIVSGGTIDEKIYNKLAAKNENKITLDEKIKA
jgi:SNF2 family DNA or RNA helicase